jgi:hypothetical protein
MGSGGLQNFHRTSESVQKRTLATTREVFASEHSFSIVTDPPIVTATFIAYFQSIAGQHLP